MFLISCYWKLIAVQDSLINISKSKPMGNDLEEFIVTEKSTGILISFTILFNVLQGIIPQSEVNSAYLTLNIADSSISDEAVLQQYQILVLVFSSHMLS